MDIHDEQENVLYHDFLILEIYLKIGLELVKVVYQDFLYVDELRSDKFFRLL